MVANRIRRSVARGSANLGVVTLGRGKFRLAAVRDGRITQFGREHQKQSEAIAFGERAFGQRAKPVKLAS